MCIKIRNTILPDNWLKSINSQHEYLKDWDDGDKDVLLRWLVEKVNFDSSIIHSTNKSVIYSIDPTKTLNAIYDWWRENENQQIIEYEIEAFPGGCFPALAHEFLTKEHEARKGWMTLFLLGAFHTIGWNTYEKNKRFVEICLSNGWMDVFVNRNENNLNDWMGVIKDFITNKIQDIEYYQWMKEFISMFTIGYWLDEYVGAFLSINRMKTSFGLSHIVCPRVNSEFQGGGPDAPPINRALGMGACFVIRELVRNGFIENIKANKLCYVPRKPVRDILSRLGCKDLDATKCPEARSKAIHEFLCDHLGPKKATFNNSFDLPLLAVAKNASLQALLFNTTILNDWEVEEDDEYVQ
jgi:hypothetical protein